jgi:hypothetical protein
MGEIKRHPKVNLIIGIIYNKIKLFEDARRRLNRKFGEIDFESPTIDFNFTPYYEKEMGKNLKRRFLSFKNLIKPEELPGIKTYTNSLEERFRMLTGSPGRNINLDPGYITSAKLVLATTKDYFHRIYLEKGIFAEITLCFRKGGFEAFEWTYPDYRTKGYKDIFNHIRRLYIKKKDG